jgi:hypothetical protein
MDISQPKRIRVIEEDTISRKLPLGIERGEVCRAGLVGSEGFSIDASLIKADVDKTKRAAGDKPIAWPKVGAASRAVREYLMALEAARSDEESGGGDDDGSSGGADRSAGGMCSKDQHQSVSAYDANYLVDNKAGIIVDAEGARANRTVEIATTETIIERAKRRFDLRPQRARRRQRLFGASLPDIRPSFVPSSSA